MITTSIYLRDTEVSADNMDTHTTPENNILKSCQSVWTSLDSDRLLFQQKQELIHQSILHHPAPRLPRSRTLKQRNLINILVPRIGRLALAQINKAIEMLC